MDKRRIAYSVLLLGVVFVGMIHTIADLTFGTGLSGVGIAAIVLALAGLVVVNR
ncbi:hypothetical protein [Natronorarus salvus]|uniref:hypothetical protein n=1 Tax=Natronorarus salvus TaxID=3117733 RepID=UPI002F262309